MNKLVTVPKGLLGKLETFWINGRGGFSEYQISPFDPGSFCTGSAGFILGSEMKPSLSLCGFSPWNVSFEVLHDKPIPLRDKVSEILHDIELSGQRIYFGGHIAEALFKEADQKTLWWFNAEYEITEIVFIGTEVVGREQVYFPSLLLDKPHSLWEKNFSESWIVTDSSSKLAIPFIRL